MKLPASIQITAGLLVALAVAIVWGAFTTYRWWTASARCDARIEALKGKAAADQAKAVSDAQTTAAGIFADSAAGIAQGLAAAAGNTAGRATIIERVTTTGACVMPAGLPSLQPAVEEARNAARD